MKKAIKWICISLCSAVIVTLLYFALAFFGNPISWTIARINCSRYLEENFGDSHFQINKVGYNFKTGGYYAFIDSPTSPDSYFTIYFDGIGRYQYDSYENVVNKQTTLSRIESQYRELIDIKFNETNTPFDISIVFGELKVAGVYEIYTFTDKNGETVEYSLDKNYGFDREELVLDKEYDIHRIGKESGRICLYIHDPTVSVDRAAELLLELKDYMDDKDIPFHAFDFHLCEPRNEEGQLTGDQITLFSFLYSDIYEEGLVDRVQQHWDIAKKHFAIQDEVKKEMENIASTQEIIIP